VKEAVREIAQELLVLYAERETVPGFAFGPDTVWQNEFEDAFPYEETPDQLKAVDDVKADMERPNPMDRLLCGDVGYGKTEVALRAAFKAVMEGKQVAVLVPTTILAQQHYITFRDRVANYPVKVDVLSRFRSAREQRLVLKELSLGTVDILIGTHRLIQEDVRFKDLGLLIVDEEQRFGVAHKEKLKYLRKNVDVLTLSATPIPRTLHMSLVGLRDTSLLETPPEGRYPIQTYVMDEDPVIMRESIRKEIGRGGQVFFVYNRIMDMERVTLWLQELVPEARIAMAHGQMREEDLEQVMLEFLEGEHDVLVCTTIIENGLDMANVNTLLVKEADMMGLAQLYQLKGRVGRSDRLAYAYFTFRRDKVLGEAAEKRLTAIREFTELGSGFKIAMRDLEIRGAGNILGAEQHGHIAAVGFDLYCRLLEEAVLEAKGERSAAPPEIAMELPIEAYIPDQYVPDANQKVEIYKRIAGFSSVDEVADLAEELVDRFGDPPEVVDTLLTAARVRILAGGLRVKKICMQEGRFRLIFHREHNLTGDGLVVAGQRYQNTIKFINSTDEFEIKIGLPGGKNDRQLALLKRLETFIGALG
jgi:transcription-repair coupling factor (superfamily II helicase)